MMLSTCALFVALRFFLLLLAPTSPVGAVPTPQSSSSPSAGSDYWVANIQRQGTVAFSSNSSYQIFRNVMDFGATGKQRLPLTC